MAKAAEAFRTISEVADDLGIQKHVLRFWEVKFSQIRPMKRGGGRRYYRPEDMELLRGIRQLLHRDGYTIKGVQKILREQGVEAVKERARTDAPATPAPAPVAVSAVVAPPPVRQRSRRRLAEDPIDRKAVIERVIAELKRCRELLSEGGAAGGTAAAPAPRAQRRSA